MISAARAREAGGMRWVERMRLRMRVEGRERDTDGGGVISRRRDGCSGGGCSRVGAAASSNPLSVRGGSVGRVPERQSTQLMRVSSGAGPPNSGDGPARRVDWAAATGRDAREPDDCR